MKNLLLTTLLWRHGALTVLLAVSAACTSMESNGDDTGVNQDKGASHDTDASHDTGAPSESGDSGNDEQLSDSGPGDSGAKPGSSDAGLARFRATLEGDTVNLKALDHVWLERCERNPQLVQRSGDAWVLLRDERPEAFNLNLAAHYLDGTLNSDCHLSLGCDVGGCEEFPAGDPSDFYAPLIAREYIEVGKLSAPSCERADSEGDAGEDSDASRDAGMQLIPSIESREPTGALGVRIRYYRDSECRTEPLTVEIAVE